MDDGKMKAMTTDMVSPINIKMSQSGVLTKQYSNEVDGVEHDEDATTRRSMEEPPLEFA